MKIVELFGEGSGGPALPAECTQCRRLFGVRGLVGGFGTASFAGSMVGPCPHCGSMGRVLDGVYSIAGEVAEFLRGPELTATALLKLQGVLRAAQAGGLSAAQTAETVRQQVPEAASFAAWLGDPRVATIVGILSMLMTLVGILIAIKQTQLSLSQPSTEDILERLLPLLRTQQNQSEEDFANAPLCSEQKD